MLIILSTAFAFTSCDENEIEPVEQESISKKSKNSSSINERPSGTSAARVLINGEPLSYTAPQPYQGAYNDGGTVMVSASAIFEALEWQVGWNGQIQMVTLSKDGTSIFLTIGQRSAIVNGNTIMLPKAPRIVNGRTMVPVRFVSEYAGARVEWDQESQSVQIYYWNKLDYGIYFYDKEPGTEGGWDAVGCQKYVPGQNNRFYNPSKPTVIYVHGFQMGGVKNHSREGLQLTEDGLNVHTQNQWKDAGYNVAIFHWVQFADDGFIPPDNVEYKIYSPTAKVGMRWKNLKGKFIDYKQHGKTMADLFAEEYRKAFGSQYNGGRIHLIGNSLGGNLAMAGLMELRSRGHAASRMPKRVTLIDPYWSSNYLFYKDQYGTLPYGARDTKDFGGIVAETMYNNYNMAIEYFRTSVAGQDGTSRRAAQQAAFIHYGMDFTFNPLSKHTVPVRQYLYSYWFPAPREIYRSAPWQSFSYTGKDAASAKTPDWRIKQMMGKNTDNKYKYWNHITGRDNATPFLDEFEIRDGVM